MLHQQPPLRPTLGPRLVLVLANSCLSRVFCTNRLLTCSACSFACFPTFVAAAVSEPSSAKLQRELRKEWLALSKDTRSDILSDLGIFETGMDARQQLARICEKGCFMSGRWEETKRVLEDTAPGFCAHAAAAREKIATMSAALGS
eukprot:m.157908 g.157908  ORF g.157908 m.157908 type:complete len:146 (-) comp10238_c0_seq8:168-605(-)